MYTEIYSPNLAHYEPRIEEIVHRMLEMIFVLGPNCKYAELTVDSCVKCRPLKQYLSKIVADYHTTIFE